MTQQQYRLSLYRHLKRHLHPKPASIAASAIARHQYQGIHPTIAERQSVQAAQQFLTQFKALQRAA